jgi:hypothetical protein
MVVGAKKGLIMTFTAEPELLLRRLEEGTAEHTHSPASEARLARLSASDSHLSVEAAETKAEINAVVWHSGQCAVSVEELQRLLKTYRYQPNITIDANSQGLRVGGSWMSVFHYCDWVIPSSALPEDMATD